MVNKLLSYAYFIYRGERKEFSEDLEGFYFIKFFLKSLISFLRGTIRFGFKKYLIGTGKNVTIKCVSKFYFSGNVMIHDSCYIDAYSQKGIKFGVNVSIGKNTHIECSGSIHTKGVGLILGDNVGIGSFNFFGCAGGIEIGEDTNYWKLCQFSF